MARIDITAKGEPPAPTRGGGAWSVRTHSGGVNCYETDRGWRYQPVCTCGYRGKPRTDPNDASNIAENHVYATDPWYRGRTF